MCDPSWLDDQRIGEMSRELEKAKTEGKKGKVRHPANGKPTKTQSLKAAGISTSTSGNDGRQHHQPADARRPKPPAA
jgi:hypothetical protein